MSDTVVRTGGCACGQVRYVLVGEPDRVGVCHCMDCRKRHGAPFNAFVTFPFAQVAVRGELAKLPGERGVRAGCARCGSPVFWSDEKGAEIELHLGGLDEIGQFEPQYELWTIRREPWVQALDVPQYPGNRPSAAPIRTRKT